MKRSRLLIAISVLAIAGMALSSASLVSHYRKSPTEYCDLGENFNCDIVNRSPYAEVAGVPVALIGMLGYAFLLAMSRVAENWQHASWILLLAAAGGLVFALRLTYIEKYVLDTWCILCLGSLAVIFLITVLAGVRVGARREG